MSIRKIWIINCVPPFNCLFQRTFSTVEKRAKSIQGQNYIPIVNTDELCSCLISEFNLGPNKDVFIENRDSCRKPIQNPVYEISTSAGDLWPVVAIRKNECLLCCLPLVEEDKRVQLVDLPCVSLALSVLLEIANFLMTTAGIHFANSPKLNQLQSYVCQAMPFGKPIETNAKLTEAKLQHNSQIITIPNKQPGWKLNDYVGTKPQIHFTITEFTRSTQFGDSRLENSHQVYGTISCKPDIHGYNSQVSVTVSSQCENNKIDIENLLIHPRVLSKDKITGPTTTWKLEFMVPVEKFPLCHYNISSSKIAEPISGLYKLKQLGKDKGDFVLQLKLNKDTMKNSFHFCEARLPFMNRGMIKRAILNPSWGDATVSPNKKMIIWNLGDRFPSKSLEVSMTATVFFTDIDKKHSDDDPFCVGQNAYAQIAFKSSSLLSGCFVDTKTLQTFPATKAKVQLDCELCAVDYKIWNSLGDTPSTTIKDTM